MYSRADLTVTVEALTALLLAVDSSWSSCFFCSYRRRDLMRHCSIFHAI